MDERTWNKKGSAEEKRQCSPQKFETLQSADTTDSLENRLRAAAHRIAPDESARERMIAGVRQGKHGRRKMAFRVPAAVLAACLFLSLLCFARPGMIGNDVVVYAATEEHGWQKLVEGERIQLKMEPFEAAWSDEDFDEGGRCMYYPYRCVFRVEVPERYLYDRQMVTIGDDSILEFGDRIEWRVAPERPENEDQTIQRAFRLWIVDEKLERQAALELELTKEDGKCYAELKRVWESKAYQKRRHKK